MISVENRKEITKKDKVRGLSRNAWMLLLLFGVTTFIFFFLYGILMTLALMILLAILEYFDDDIYDIVSINLQYSFRQNYYA
ncbi:hypothetical protein CQA53_05655 [Helicobacter didelphidarum]|uniref:Uncharacterized protein n=1 Tax=Helicobacter didelphidarum TaxID=2040648 RepID=A0A3D8IKR8_9HELI|nr:hypothetical protein [Helicobacter didelphidarum]RDU65778.1 hypothetical protein CQA53_05655 [Helicobacter didelphidarum]